MHQIRVVERRCGRAVGQGESVARRPDAPFERRLQYVVGALELTGSSLDAVRIALALGPPLVARVLLHGFVTLLIEEAILQPHLERGVALRRDEPRGSGMVDVEVF